MIVLTVSVGEVYAQNINQYQNRKHTQTNWDLSPSFKFDTLCFLNTLSGDPYYLDYYQEEYKKFEPKLTPEVKKSLGNLKRIIKDENQNIISAFLTLYFSATDDETLEDMLKTLDNSETMRANLQKTPYYNEASWKMYESVKLDLKVIFLFLKDIEFDKYWKQNVLPKIESRADEVKKVLPKYNVISEVENHLGYDLSSNKITVYMLFYSQPHGIKITGTRFLTDIAWSFGIVLRNAVHEMMHPPYDLKTDKELDTALNLLKKDTFLMNKIKNHNPAFGYNSFEGFIEEDTVQAVEQIINEKLGIAVDARQRWKNSDDGMHVFAAALYSVMKNEGFPNNNESLREFLLRIIRSGKFSAGKVRTIYETFYDDKKLTDSGLPDSEKTQILILATSHLRNVKDCLKPEAMDKLLNVLGETFKPDLVAVEEITPAVIEDMERRGGYLTEVNSFFSKEQITTGKALKKKLGVSRKQAETESRKILKETDLNNTENRLKLITYLLAAYDYDSAILQWSKLPPTIREKQTAIPKDIAEQLSKSLTFSNEQFTIGTALAKRLGLQRIYGIDDHFDKEIFNQMVKQFLAEIKDNDEVAKASKAKLYTESAKDLREACNDKEKMFEHYLDLNSKEFAEQDVALQWGVWFRTKLPSKLDRSRVAQWEMRNLNIASRIREISVFHPVKKILVIIGAGHKPFLDLYLSNMLDVKIVQLRDLQM